MPESLVKRRDLSGLLAQLVDRSLVHFDERTGRYRMIESVRDFARELAEDIGEEETQKRRFFSHMLNLSSTARSGLMGKEEVKAHAFINSEIDNFRAALEWGLAAHGMEDLALRLAADLGRYWQIEHVDEGRRWLQAAFEKAKIPDPVDLAWGEYYLARVRIMSDQMQGIEELLDSSVRRMEAIGDARGLCLALHNTSWPLYRAGDLARLKEVELRSLKLAKEYGYPEYTTGPLTGLGEAARLEGDFRLARNYYEEALQIMEQSKLEGGALPVVLLNLGAASLELGELDEADRFYRWTLKESLSFASSYSTAGALVGLAMVWLARGDFERGGRLFGYSTEAFALSGRVNDPADEKLYQKSLAEAKKRGGEVFERAAERGRAMTEEQALALVDASV